ncbi:MAG: copper chaperone PCu(A)C [Alphaproteobacteria bacterium]
MTRLISTIAVPLRTAFATGVFSVLCLSAAAETIRIEDPWARASAGAARNGAAFMTIHAGAEVDRLVGASSEVASTIEIHTHERDGDIMRMRPVSAIEVPAQGSVALRPGGYHVMLIGLHAPLVEGATFALTLDFEKAGAVPVEVAVQGPGAMGPGSEHGQHGHGQHGHGKHGHHRH